MKLVQADPEVKLTLQSREGGHLKTRNGTGLMPQGLPVLHCSVCMLGPECPEYQQGYVCAFESKFRDIPTRDLDEVTTLVASILEENVLRLRRARLVEDILLGGEVDPKTTHLSKVVLGQAKILAELMASRKSMVVEAKGEGILSKLFGRVLDNSQPTITIEAEDTK